MLSTNARRYKKYNKKMKKKKETNLLEIEHTPKIRK